MRSNVKLLVYTVWRLVGGAPPAPTPAWSQEGQMPPMGPPEELKTVAFLQGDWDVDVQVRMTPDGEWQNSKGSASITLVLDGCAQRQEFEGTMMGMPFKGEETLTYNRETKQFESFWMDSMSAHMAVSKGGWQGDKFVMTGKDMMMGQQYMMRNSFTKGDPNEVQWDMDMSTDNGKTWFTTMKMTYKKKTM
jgi:hypothetical protein